MMRSALPLMVAWNQTMAGAVLLPTALAGLTATYALRCVLNPASR